MRNTKNIEIKKEPRLVGWFWQTMLIHQEETRANKFRGGPNNVERSKIVEQIESIVLIDMTIRVSWIMHKGKMATQVN